MKITPRKKGWYRAYRLPGIDPVTGKRRSPKLLFLGDYHPAFRLAEARRAEALAKVAKGRDPLAERRAERAAQLAETDAMNVAGLIASYIADRSDQWRPNTVKAFARDLDLIKRGLGTPRVADVSRVRLVKFLQDFITAQQKLITAQQKRGRRGTEAERLRMLLGSLFGYAIELDLITASPAIRLRLPAVARYQSRERVLNADELRETWRALDRAAMPSALALQISLATGARIGAVALAAASELELTGRLDAETDGKPVWHIPPLPGRKSRVVQIVPLSPLAVALWRRALAWPGRNPSDPVFPGRKAGLPLSPVAISEAWSRWRDAGRLPSGTTAHDLRRSAGPWWGNRDLAHGQGRDTMERLLGHVVGGKIERIYDRGLYLPQQRAVADAWGRWLSTITATAKSRSAKVRRAA